MTSSKVCVTSFDNMTNTCPASLDNLYYVARMYAGEESDLIVESTLILSMHIFVSWETLLVVSLPL